MRKYPLFCLLLVHGCTSPVPRDTKSVEGAQHVFFPERYDYSVGDFVLSLPIGYYATSMKRLAFAQKVIETGSPKPVLEQKKYLVLEEDALAPKRHYLLLDQRHLLIYSEVLQLADGSPAKLEVLHRTGDAGWTDVSNDAVPEWARTPRSVTFSVDRSGITVTGSSGSSQSLVWNAGKLEAQN